MNNLFRGYNDLDFDNCDSIVHGHIEYDDSTLHENDAHKLLRRDCKEYYHVSMNQLTVIPRYPHDAPIESILSEEGLKQFKFVSSRAEKEENFKDEMVDYAFDFIISGGWFADEKSPFYDPEDVKGILNCRNDIQIYGWSKTHQLPISTSRVVFVNNMLNPKWCITKSGSLYKLGTKRDIWEMQTIVKERLDAKGMKNKDENIDNE